MKTLVFYGSARKKGHTKQMLDLLLENLEGEVEVIDAYRTEVKPCMDCRYCWKVKGCSIKDNMQEIYKKVEEADNYVFASPMYFHSVTGPMKTLIDRLQVYWAGSVRKDKPKEYIKNGVILMVGGAPDFEDQFKAGEIVLKGALGDLRAKCLGVATIANSDRETLDDNEDVKQQIIEMAHQLNKSLELSEA